MANICFVSLKIECRSKRAALKVNAVLTQLKEATDQQRKGFDADSDRYIFDAAFYVYEKEISMAYWVKWGYSDEQEHLQQAFERYGTTREIPFS